MKDIIAVTKYLQVRLLKHRRVRLFLIAILVLTFIGGLENQVFKVMHDSGREYNRMFYAPSQSSRRENGSLFSRVLTNFDWKSFLEALRHSNSSEIEPLQENLINALKDLLVIEPTVELNASCHPPPLVSITETICSALILGNAFTGNVQPIPPKVGILIQFGFSVDVLEMYLNEVYELVDRFFILESTRTHFRALRKPLIWDHVKNQRRFAKFANKIVHLIIDDAESSAIIRNYSRTAWQDNSSTWNMEFFQEEKRWTKFLEWNKENQLFGSNDLLGFGDADEIPSRQTLHLLKSCELNHPVVDVGLWFAYGNIESAFVSDFPVPGHWLTYADPTFFTLQAAQSYASIHKYPTRLRGKSGNFVLGGIHMTFSTYLPFQFIRAFTCTECFQLWNTTFLEHVARRIRVDELLELEAEVGVISQDLSSRLMSLQDMEEEMRDTGIVPLPWLYSCNRERYPTWEGKHDTRLD